MSRVGKMPIAVPQGRGRDDRRPSRSASRARSARCALPLNRAGQGQERRRQADASRRPTTRVEANAMSGTMRALVANMVGGVTKGFEKKLTLVGVGYRAQAQGDKLNLTLGFSHPVVQRTCPRASRSRRPTQTEIVIKGADRQAVGQVAAEVRALPSARALQGQGHPLRGREGHDQRNQEEVRSARPC